MLISVVIPVYNAEKYLDKCIDSIIGQTWKDLEIVCVNDGSTDASMDILQRYAAEDSRVRILNQENRGVSAARNAGLDAASGKYLIFVDSDDCLRADALKKLAGRMDRDDLDILYFDGEISYHSSYAGQIFPEDKYKRTGTYPGVYTGEQLMDLFEEQKDYYITPCMLMSRRSYLSEQDIHFYQGIIHEDNLFSFQVMLLARRAAYMKEAFYIRNFHAGSIMTSPVGFKNVYGYFTCYREMARLLQNFPITDDCFDRVCTVAVRPLKNAQNLLMDLPEKEAEKWRELPVEEQILFRVYVLDNAELRKKQRQKIRDLEERVRTTKKEKDEQIRSLYEKYESKSIKKTVKAIAFEIRKLFSLILKKAF